MPQDTLVHKEREVPKVLKEFKEQQDLRVLKVIGDHKVRRVHKGRLVIQVPKDKEVHREPKVPKELKVP